MSALQAHVTEEHRGHPSPGGSVRRSGSRVQVQAERRAERRTERQSRRRWAMGSCAILVASFVLTAGILDVLH